MATAGISANPVQGQTQQSSATAVLDSLRIARDSATHGKSCVAAFGLAVRQFGDVAANEDQTIAAAHVFQTLSVVSRYGGDVGTSVIFSEAALCLAKTVLPHRSPDRGPFLLAHALAVRLSGQPGARDLAVQLVTEGLGNITGDEIHDPATYADLQQAQANFSRATGNISLAIAQYKSALETRLKFSHAHELETVDTEVWLASALRLSGNSTITSDLFVHCRENLIALGLPHHPLMAAVLTNLALIAQASGDVPRARDYYYQTQAQLQQARKMLFPGFSQRRLMVPTLNALVYIHLAADEHDLAWRAFATGHRRTENLAQALTRARESDPAFATQVRRTTTRAVHMLGEVEAALKDLRAIPGDDVTRDHATQILIRYARTMAEALALRNQLRGEYETEPAKAQTIAQFQKRLRPEQAFVGYVSTSRPDRSQKTGWSQVTYAVVVGNDGPPQWVMVSPNLTQDQPSTAALISGFTKLMGKASEWPTRLPNDPRVSSLLHTFFTAYFEPLQPFLTAKSEIILLANNMHNRLPFAALIDNEGLALVDRYALLNVVSIDDVGHRQSNGHESGLPSLVLGDPAYIAENIRTETPDPTLSQAISTYANTVLPRSVVTGVLKDGVAGFDELPRLLSSGWEARGIAGMSSPVTLLTGLKATEQNLNLACGGAQPRHYRWIHLATHALMHSAIPERSALALSPLAGEGLLYVEEIGFGWTLNCDLVTLSGCQTGGGPASWTAGRLGFVQALQAAGAKNLLLSTEKVDDIATALLMERFYANISNRASPRVEPAVGAPLSYSFALAEAQRWLRDIRTPEGKRPFEHPVYWANFRLIGNGG